MITGKAGMGMNVGVAAPAQTNPEGHIIEPVTVPAVPVVNVRCLALIAHLAAGVVCHVLLTQLGIIRQLPAAFLAHFP